MQKLISVDLRSQFGFLKKPDINDGIYLSYNMLHKPALLGILGAIAGFEGYKIEGAMKPNDIPEYRKRLEDLEVSILPLHSQNGNFSKDVIKYTNTIGYASEEEGGVLIINEQTLICPSYQVFFHLDMGNKYHDLLFKKLENHEAEYIPYLGKNDHQLWWDNFQEWKILDKECKPRQNFKIDSIFIKPSEERIKRQQRSGPSLFGVATGSFMYFERLPIGWHSELPHYQLNEFLLTDFPLLPENELTGLLRIQNEEGEQLTIQIF
jgi:CRISPR-associated protein Cas5h